MMPVGSPDGRCSGSPEVCKAIAAKHHQDRSSRQIHGFPADDVATLARILRLHFAGSFALCRPKSLQLRSMLQLILQDLLPIGFATNCRYSVFVINLTTIFCIYSEPRREVFKEPPDTPTPILLH